MYKIEPFANQVYFKNSQFMGEVPDNSVQMIITSPPYFNIKDYSKDGYQTAVYDERTEGQIGGKGEI